MKILHVVENLERGGLERVVVDLATRQRADGHDVSVACVFERGQLASELDALQVPMVACGKQGGLDMLALRRLRQRLHVSAGGVLHTHNATAHYLATVAGIGFNWARVVSTRHGMGATEPASRKEWLYRRTMPRTDVVAAVCEAARARFAAQGVVPRVGLVTAPNGIQVEKFQRATLQARMNLAQALGLGERARIVGTVGRLSAIKDQAMLIEAFRCLHARMPEAALVIVGDGPLRAELQAQAEAAGVAQRIRFLGDRDDVAALLPGFDVFALSSRSEGYSIALLEATATGLPMITTDVGGNAEIVREGRSGWLVPAGNPVAFSEALNRVLGDADAGERMGAYARAWAEAHGSLRSMAARYQALYGVEA